jgi:hypothetical protein
MRAPGRVAEPKYSAFAGSDRTSASRTSSSARPSAPGIGLLSETCSALRIWGTETLRRPSESTWKGLLDEEEKSPEVNMSRLAMARPSDRPMGCAPGRDSV